MIRFRSEFLAQFPSKLGPQLKEFTSFIDGWEDLLGNAPEITWPPPTLLPDIFDYHIELLWQANGVRGLNLCRGIVQSLNESNFLCFAIIFRAFFEHVLLIRQYLHTRLSPILSGSAKKGRVESQELARLIAELHTSIRRSKVNWEELLTGDLTNLVESAAVSDKVLLKNAAQHWDDGGAKVGAFIPTHLYAVLCDLAHPNLGSSLICMKHDGFGFAKTAQSSMGARIFGLLYPSLAAVALEFQSVQNAFQGLKFDAGAA